MFKYTYNQLPSLFCNIYNLNSNIHSYPTRHSSDYHLENPRTVFAQRSMRYNGPVVWNSLPSELKRLPSLHSFKSSLKKHLLSIYTADWIIIKAYIPNLIILLSFSFSFLFPHVLTWLLSYFLNNGTIYDTISHDNLILKAQHMHALTAQALTWSHEQ